MEIQSFDYREKMHFSNENACKTILSETSHARTTLWCLKPGQQIHPHVHAGDHVWVILEGTGSFLRDDGPEFEVQTGGILSAPAGTSHGVKNNGPGDLVFVSVSAD